MFEWINKPYVLWSIKDSFLATIEIFILIAVVIAIINIILSIKEKINKLKKG